MWHKISRVPHIRVWALEGVGGELRLPFRHSGTSGVPKELSMVSKLQYKAKQVV